MHYLLLLCYPFPSPSEVSWKESLQLDSVLCSAADKHSFSPYRLWYMRENARKDKIQRETGQTHEADFSDITDVENISFRYHM